MATFGVSQDVIPGNLTVQGIVLNTTVVDAITAKAGGAQQTSGASVIPAGTAYFRVATVATIADSVTLPSCNAAGGVGAKVTVYNQAANSANVFPALGDNINTAAANAAFAVAGTKSAEFVCTSFSTTTGVGRWVTVLSA
jgi:predicted small secreted protein